MQFYIYVVQFMCGQIQQIQGIWCEFGRVFLLTYCFNSCVVCGYNCFIYYLLDIENMLNAGLNGEF